LSYLGRTWTNQDGGISAVLSGSLWRARILTSGRDVTEHRAATPGGAANVARPLLDLGDLLDRIERDNPGLSGSILEREVDQLLERRRVFSPAPISDIPKRRSREKRRQFGAFGWYQSIVAESQPLSQQEAQEAAAVVEAGLLAEERLELMVPHVAPEGRRELEILAYEGRIAYDLLVLSNIRLVFHWCKGIARSMEGDAVQDAFQAGCIGLMRGIQGWDHRMGFTLSTYVSWHIRQSVQRWRMNEISLIRVPVHVWEQLDSSKTKMAPETRKAAELALQVVSVEEVDLEKAAGEWDGGLEDVLQACQHERLLEAAFARLDEREGMVLRMRHGAGTVSTEPMTLEEIGRVLGVTRERIRQIEAKALGKLRAAASNFARYL
jgi:RNA polymerase primary sigma factor